MCNLQITVLGRHCGKYKDAGEKVSGLSIVIL